MGEVKEILSREEIDEIKKDFKEDKEMELLCNMAIMSLRFYGKGGTFTIRHTINGPVFVDHIDQVVPTDMVLSMLNDRDMTLQLFQECYKVVGKEVSDPTSLAMFLQSKMGTNPGRSILRELLAGRISVGKMGELMELKLGELHELKLRLGAFNEQDEGARGVLQMFLDGNIPLSKLLRMYGFGQEEVEKMIRRCKKEEKLLAEQKLTQT